MPATVIQSPLYFQLEQTRESLLAHYREVRGFTQRLCDPLEVEDYVVQSMEDASPTRWHIAHTTWFFEAFVLSAARPGYQSQHPHYDYLFNSYYVQAGERYPRPQRGLITRPTVADAYDYRASVDEQVFQLLQDLSDDDWAQVAALVTLGLNHEQQHQELMLTDLKHVFSFNPLRPVYQRRQDPGEVAVPPMGWVSFSEGLYQLGHSGLGFCYDNEMPRHRQFLQGFQMADRLVTNGEYLEFIRDGGYRTETLWLSDGAAAVAAEGWRAPLYWIGEGADWQQYSLGGLHPVNLSEPVCHVSCYEADAFARWAGCRLPSEAEWEVAVAGATLRGNFADQGYYHPRPLQPESSGGLQQVYGDVWEWTGSPYIGYPGYRPGEGALGEYNGKFMSGQMVLRGGSCATSRSHIRKTYRNFFQPSKRWQFTGLRLAKDA